MFPSYSSPAWTLPGRQALQKPYKTVHFLDILAQQGRFEDARAPRFCTKPYKTLGNEAFWRAKLAFFSVPVPDFAEKLIKP